MSDFSEITDPKKEPEKLLSFRMKKKGGRNFQGRITARHRGGGHKKIYRMIDFDRDKDGVPAKVAFIEYDPNRSARIALLHYADGEKRYILAPEGLKVGDKVESGLAVEPNVGNAMPLEKIPPGTQVHCIEMQPGKRRAALPHSRCARRDERSRREVGPGSRCRPVKFGGSPAQCRATVGVIGNSDHINVSIGKAGRKRWMGRRPHVRGVAMNPVAHPMGGGEGRSSGGRHPCSPTGVLSKGGRTRKRRKPSSKAIIRRRKSRRYGQLKI